MIELVCMNDFYYDTIPDFIEDNKLEKAFKKVFADEIKEYWKDEEDPILAATDRYGMEVIDSLAPAYLKKVYPEDYWKRSLVWETNDYSEGFKIIIYRIDCNNKEDAIKFVSNLIKEYEINTVDLFEDAIKELK